MATVYVGSASIDENGKAYGGQAGNQSGRELRRQKWYLHSKGWRVLRAKDRNRAVWICAAMEAAIANRHIGYDQWQRNTLYTQAEKVGFDLTKVSKDCETDCSALVRVCCAAAGITGLPSEFRTYNEASELLKTGMFVELKGAKYTEQSAYLGAGDILVTKTSGHTVVVLNDGGKYEGSGVQTEYQLGDRILRNGDSGEDVKTLQSYLLKLGYDLGKWGADGDFGDCTQMAVMVYQDRHGLEADGEAGPMTIKALAAEILEQTVPAGKNVSIVGGDCYIRAQPSTDGDIIGVATRGSLWPFLGDVSEAGWLNIEYAKGSAWVSGKYGTVR